MKVRKTIMDLRAWILKKLRQPIENHILYDLSKPMQLPDSSFEYICMHTKGKKGSEIRWVKIDSHGNLLPKCPLKI